ncbi:MAG: hypothetical protein CMO34_00150 [Verrucomicrobia bacterium]|nr:hypothetical protein [Verrucomicrobiota bacterium]|tara:strand:- start:255 stop:779 length:525 start_codon:yes stop_codon:yes gene_type:complete
MKTTLFLFILLISIGLNAQHTVVLNSGEKMDCIVLSLNEDVWDVVYEGEARKIHMKDVSSVFFKEYIAYDGKLIPEGNEKSIVVNGFPVKYKIKDRTFDREPKVSIGSQDKGTVVVDIIVDRYGNVLSAKAGAPGTNTSNNYLYVKAETAAKSAKFDENLKGPLKTEGTITIIY